MHVQTCSKINELKIGQLHKKEVSYVLIVKNTKKIKIFQ